MQHHVVWQICTIILEQPAAFIFSIEDKSYSKKKECTYKRQGMKLGLQIRQ